MAGQTSLRGFLQMLAACLAALAICAVAVIYAAPAPLVLATAGGVAMLAIIVIIRRLGLGLMAGGALVALAALGAGIAAVGQTGASSNPTLRFATSVTQAKLSVVERMITDNGIGSGAGTFAALLPLYANFDDASLRAAPTLAAQISIEMGKAAPFIAAVLALMLVAILLRGAFERGRDSFYAAGAAACTVTFLTEAFMDSSLLTTSAMLVAATILGLGFAQRLSRSLQ
jgi:hypothetical protein